MATKLTQGGVNRLAEDHPAGTQIYDADTSGLRIVVGSKSSSYKLVGRINDGSNRYVSIIIGRTDEMSLRTARERSAEIKLALRRGDDPRTPKRTVPSLKTAWERYKETRGPDPRIIAKMAPRDRAALAAALGAYVATETDLRADDALLVLNP